jgi:tetratricopeptide (TPR) repeat protein
VQLPAAVAWFACCRDKAYEVALVYYQGCLALHPGSASAYNNLALTHLKLGNHIQAASDAGAALRLEPGNVKALLRLAEARAKLKEYSAAQEVSNSAEGFPA